MLGDRRRWSRRLRSLSISVDRTPCASCPRARALAPKLFPPDWNRTQYGQFVNGTWDVVIMMLGTNDAKDVGNGGAPNWPAGCSAPSPTAATCSVIADYLALIKVRHFPAQFPLFFLFF